MKKLILLLSFFLALFQSCEDYPGTPEAVIIAENSRSCFFANIEIRSKYENQWDCITELNNNYILNYGDTVSFILRASRDSVDMYLIIVENTAEEVLDIQYKRVLPFTQDTLITIVPYIN